MAEAERYGHNVVAAQIDDQMTQEAFRDQERVNAELKSKINSLSDQVAALRGMLQEQAETLAIFMDE
tara:strand:+ start:2505 stop:2705 length:201 start_codon:yes stop_codon:yes gene_type:complete